MSAPSTPLGTILRRLRLREGLTIEELAYSSQVSPRAISDLERGVRRAPHQRTIAALSHALKLSEHDISELKDAFRAAKHRSLDTTKDPLLLPQKTPGFVGRSGQLETITTSLTASPTDNTAGAVVIVTGMPGIGKTSLAIEAASILEATYQRQVFVDLTGTGINEQTPAAIAHRLLTALAPAEIPAATDQQMFMQLQSIVRDQKVLLVLDNALNEAQVRPLLPNGGSGAAIVTSRHRLAGLLGVTYIALPELASQEAYDFLRGALPQQLQDKTEMHALARLCGYMPLALRIAANQVAAYPDRTVAHVVTRLQDLDGTVDALTAGDLSVQTACRASYDDLSPTAQLVFRRLGLADAATVSVGLASLLTGLPETATRRALDNLAERSLLDPTGSDRYTAHGLLWRFAKQALKEEEPAKILHEARATADRFVLESVALMGASLSGSVSSIDPGWRASARFRAASAREAVAWLLAERMEWQGAISRADTPSDHRRVTVALHHLHWFSKMWHRQVAWEKIFGMGAESAEQLGMHSASCVFYGERLWFMLAYGAHNDQADHVAWQMDSAAAQADDPAVVAWTDYYRANLLMVRGQPTEALERAQQVVKAMRERDEPAVAVIALQQLAEISLQVGELEQAHELLHEMHALLMTSLDSIPPIAATLAQANGGRLLAETNHQLGNWDSAVAASTVALEAFETLEQLPEHPLMSVILDSRAIAYEQLGRPMQALADRSRVRELLKSS